MEIEIEPLTGISFRTLVFIWKSIFDEYQIFSIFNWKKLAISNRLRHLYDSLKQQNT